MALNRQFCEGPERLGKDDGELDGVRVGTIVGPGVGLLGEVVGCGPLGEVVLTAVTGAEVVGGAVVGGTVGGGAVGH